MPTPRPLARAAVLAALGLALLPTPGRAQSVSEGCAGRAIYLQDACQKAVDIFNVVAPQLGTALAGGNAVLGQTSTLGRFGRISAGIRVNAMRGAVPQADGVSIAIGGAQRTPFETESQLVVLPTAEGAFGLFAGVPLGVTNVGGVDALVSATYVPDLDVGAVSIATFGNAVKLGYGVRLGILQESAVVPGVSVTYLRRTLPIVGVQARTGTDTISVNGIDATTSAWRVVAGKRFLAVGIAAGYGQDRYDASASAGAVINRTIPGVVTARLFEPSIVRASQRMTRTNAFVDLSLYLPFARVVGEVGRARGGEVPTPYNSFGGKTGAEAYTYASVGLRLQL